MKKHMRKRLLALLAVLMLILCGCGETKIVHCDHCGDEITLEADSNITEDWIVFCKQCEEDLFADNPVVDPGESKVGKKCIFSLHSTG